MTTGWNDLEDVEVYDLQKSEKAQGNNILVIDALNLAFRWKNDRFKVSKDTDAEVVQDPGSFAEEYCDTLYSLAKSYNATHIIVAADGQDSSRYRKNIFPEYKGNRKLIQETQTEAERLMFNYFWNAYQDVLTTLDALDDFKLFKFEGVEADDIAAYICSNLPSGFDYVWLVSSDKDWDQLVSDKVSRFNWMTQKNWKNVTKTGPRPKEITKENWFEHHLAPQNQYLLVRCLEGDTSDNIDGIIGVGPKRAATLAEKYDTVDNLLDSLPLPGKAQYIQRINESEELLKRNLSLIDLLADPVGALGEENIEELDKYLFSIEEV